MSDVSPPILTTSGGFLSSSPKVRYANRTPGAQLGMAVSLMALLPFDDPVEEQAT